MNGMTGSPAQGNHYGLQVKVLLIFLVVLILITRFTLLGQIKVIKSTLYKLYIYITINPGLWLCSNSSKNVFL